MEKLEEMQWSVVWQEDASETEGKSVQNCGQTISVVWCGDLGSNVGTRSTTRSKGDEDAEMDLRSHKEGSDPKRTHYMDNKSGASVQENY